MQHTVTHLQVTKYTRPSKKKGHPSREKNTATNSSTHFAIYSAIHTVAHIATQFVVGTLLEYDRRIHLNFINELCYNVCCSVCYSMFCGLCCIVCYTFLSCDCKLHPNSLNKICWSVRCSLCRCAIECVSAALSVQRQYVLHTPFI